MKFLALTDLSSSGIPNDFPIKLSQISYKSRKILMFVGYITIFLWFSYGFPMVFIWFLHRAGLLRGELLEKRGTRNCLVRMAPYCRAQRSEAFGFFLDMVFLWLFL